MICLSEVFLLIVLFLNFHEIFSGIFSNCSVLGETYTSDISRKKPGSCILTAILKHYSAFFSISETKSLIKLKPAFKKAPGHVGSYIFLEFLHSQLNFKLAGDSYHAHLFVHVKLNCFSSIFVLRSDNVSHANVKIKR